MIELIIIKLFLYKDIYIKYRKYIKPDKEQEHLFLCLDDMQQSLNKDILFSEFKLVVLQKFPNLQETLLAMEKEQVGQEVAEHVVKSYIERKWAHDVALKAILVSEGTEDVSKLRETYDSLGNEIDEDKQEFIPNDIDKILEGLDRRTGGLRWRLPSLDRTIGGLQRGDFGFIFARPETGKTTFLASEISHFASQAERPVIWANNEEDAWKVKGRMIQGALGCSIDQMQQNKEKVVSRFEQVTRNNFLLKDLVPMHKRDIERIMEEYKPSLFVFDQIDKIKGFKGDRDDLMLGGIYVWARELAKEYCPIIGVCQASASADNKKWLTSEDIAKSKTEKLAEADFVIGIGKTFDAGYEDVRYLHLIKNKLTGIHAKIECLIDTTIARYKDI